MTIEITKQIDATCREVYTFEFFDDTYICLHSFTEEHKAFNKRMWIVKEEWRRINDRYNTIEEPILDDFIKSEVLRKAKEALQVITWSEYKNRKFN